MVALEADLRQRFRVSESSVTFPDRRLDLLHPANADDLIDPVAFDRDERLPYWADLWPSSQMLAAELLTRNGTGQRMLELGCGLGLVATAASLAGYDVTVSDYYEEAMEFATLNAARNGAPAIRSRHLDWRSVASDVPQFDLVVAADVLYERLYGGLVAQVVARTLTPEGSAIIADPGRVGRGAFLTEASRLGLVVSMDERPFEAGAIRQTIALIRLGWGGDAAHGA
jgi:ETFB lysine methyltransferase